MKYKCMLLFCIITCIFFTSSVFASDVADDTIGENFYDIEELQVNSNDVKDTDNAVGDSFSTSVVYFDASADKDGDGSKSNPYKIYSSDRIEYGTTAYFADGVYEITKDNSTFIHSSSTSKTTFIGQSIENTIFKSKLSNKFDFTVTENSYLVLKNLKMVGVHINNQANLIADNVEFRESSSFNPDYPPSLSYSYISKLYDSTYGGVIICDTPAKKVTTLNLTDCYFKSNSASSGGVIAAYNTIADIQNCVFYNSSAERFGGAIYSIKSSFNVRNSSFEQSSAKYAGAIYANCSDFNLKDSHFDLSRAFSFGGVIASFSSKLDINNVIFNDFASLNDAGGAIYSTGGTINVADSSFIDGYSDFGGAISSLKTDTAVSGSKFIDTHATYYGGSIYNMYGSLDLSQNIFTNSYAASGGSVFNRLSDSFTLTNNHFTNSTADEGPIVFVDGNNVKVKENGNIYDASYILLKYGNIYDIDYYESVPIINFTPEVIDVVPSSYDSRKYGYVTPAKDQIQGGNCWAFSGIATLEACLKKATGIAYDFSEENVKNLMSEYSLFDSDNGVNSGGNLYMFIAYLAGWFGPIYDEYDTYDDFSALSVIYDSIVHVQNVYILPERQNFYDNDHIKQAVLKYGAVSIGIELSNNRGHAVTIVGWDDEFTSSDFLGNKALGAWIIKNSWGSQWGYDGFGYLSYQQPINFGYTFIFDDERGYNNIYQYDFEGKSGFHSVNNNQVYMKNKFTAKNDEILSAFSTYFDEPSNYTASVYLNGKLVTTQNGYSDIGYYTIPLAKEISMKKGDTFEIQVKFFNDGSVYFPLCEVSEINKMNFGEGISFLSLDGNSWTDLFKSASPGVACIKAFTRLETLTEVSIDVDQSGTQGSPFGDIYVDDLVNIELALPEYYEDDGIKHSIEGLVTFTVNGQYYFATVENGKACLNISFKKEGQYTITAQYKSSRLISNIVKFTADVAKTAESDMVIQANDISKFYGGSEKYVATFSNDGKALSGVNVKISVNGEEYIEKTDNNGQVVLDLDLPVGVYEVTAQYGGKVVTSKFTVLTTIQVDDVTRDFLDAYVSASFLNTDGNALVNEKISYVISIYGVNSLPISVSATTDKAGLATAKANIGADKYSVSVVNPVSGEKKQFILDIVQIDSKNLLSVNQIGSDIIINATINPIVRTKLSYVNFLVSGQVYKVMVNNVVIDGSTVSVASLKLSNLAVGTYNVTSIFSGDQNFKVSSDSREFTVTNKPYKLQSANYYSYYGGSGTIATITDGEKPVKGEVVYATIANETYSSTTDEDGKAYFNLDLEVGNYTVLFEYKGQSLIKNVHVYSTVQMVVSNEEYLNSKIGAHFIYPFAEQPSSWDVKFIINGTEYAATTDSNGYASVDVDLPVGVHTITTINLCNGEKKQSKITIYKTTPSISLTKSKRGDSVFITADLARTSAEGFVVFTMGSNKYTTLVSKGKAVLALNVLEEGSYEVYANYIGDLNFNNILSHTMKFDYEHTNYSLSTQNVEKYYGGPEKFKVTLNNFNKPVSNADINLIINDVEYTIKTDANGVASFERELNPGIYGVQVNFDDKTELSSITVKPTITVLGGIGDVSYSKLSAEFIDGNGKLVANKIATFKIASKEYKQTTDAYGVATLEVNLDRGNYTVEIINPVTGETKYSTLVITKSTPNISLSAVKEEGVDVLKAVLPKDATGTVDFDLGNEGIYTIEIIDGVARLEGLDPGTYDVTVNYKGDGIYNPASKSTVFKVSEIVSVLYSSDVKTTYGTAKNIVVTLKDSTGEILAGKIIKVILNNKIYTSVMPSDGKASVTVPSSLVPKTYTATISYDGDESILGTTKKIKVTVNKATPKLTAAKKTFKVKDKTKKYVVTLKTHKNKVYKNQKITIKVNGKTYSAKTNSKGQATLKLTKLTKKGTFTAVVKYAGNSYYKALSKKVKITVKK